MNAEKILGWGIKGIENNSIAKALRQEEGHSIVELKNGKVLYFLEKTRQLSPEEALLLRNVVSEFQSSKNEPKETELYNALKQHCIKNVVELSREQRNLLLELFSRQVFGFGVLSFLIEDEEIEEISVIGTGNEKPVFVFHRAFGWLETNMFFSSETEVRDVVNKMARKLERRLTMHTPRINAVLPNGSRLHAAIFPISFLGPSITIRKFFKNPFTPAQLVQKKTISLEAAAFLWLAMEVECSLLVAGNTGSGKTSTLNSLFSFVPKQERIIGVEETPEIVLPHKHLVKLSVVENLGIGMQELINDTLRMRPDRVIVGEVRTSGEAKAFIQTLLAGQGKGSYATFHAQSAAECITRLKKLGVMETDLNALDLIVVQKRWTRIDSERNTFMEQRRITEIVELEKAGNAVEFNTLFGFDYKKDCLRKTGESKRVMEKAENAFSKNKKGIEKEIIKKEQRLRELKARDLDFSSFFLEIQGVRQ